LPFTGARSRRTGPSATSEGGNILTLCEDFDPTVVDGARRCKDLTSSALTINTSFAVGGLHRLSKAR
jgi:hypothetical protein